MTPVSIPVPLAGSPASVRRPENRGGVLIAISERERADFLPFLPPDGGPSIPGARGVAWFDSKRGSAEDWTAVLREFRPEVLVSCWTTPPLPADAADRPDLRYVCHLTGSVRRLVPRAFIENGGLVSNWGDAVSPQVAEHALLLALLALRNGARWRGYIRDLGPTHANPSMVLDTRTLFGRRVGLHGFGRVARALVGLLKPFGAEVSAWSEGVPTDFIRSHGVRPCASLRELFSGSEVLIECEALTPQNAGSVDAAALAALPDGAVFVNVGRGAVVDEAALEREAASGRLRIALDVVKEEPMTSASAIFAHESALFSPHIAGPTADRYQDCGRFALDNVARYLAGRPVLAQITLADYDRST